MSEAGDARVSAGKYAPGHAPRVMQEDVDKAIVAEDYVLMPDGRTTICQLTLRNGFTVRGESTCVFAENFDAELGRKYAFEKAKNQIWQLEGYLLAQRHYEDSERFAGG